MCLTVNTRVFIVSVSDRDVKYQASQPSVVPMGIGQNCCIVAIILKTSSESAVAQFHFPRVNEGGGKPNKF